LCVREKEGMLIIPEIYYYKLATQKRLKHDFLQQWKKVHEYIKSISLLLNYLS